MSEGTTAEGCKFEQFCRDFKGAVEDQFVKFAKHVFREDIPCSLTYFIFNGYPLAPSERVKRSLPGTESLRNYTVPAGKPLPSKPIASTSKASTSSVASQDELDRNTLRAMGRVVEDDAEDDTNVEMENITPARPPDPARPRYKSQYEIDREKNIKDNQALLVSLGLDKPILANPNEKKQRAPRTKRIKGTAAVRKSSRFVAR